MRKLGLFLLGFFISSCASGPLSKQSDLESGSRQQGAVIYCSGYKTWQDCDRSAAQACPKGYEVLSKEENLVIQGRTLRIQCK